MSEQPSSPPPLNFIRGFVKLLQGTEVPEAFAMWTAIGCVSCVLGRRVWLPMGIFTLYPNLYIVFVAPPGGGKTTAIEYATDNIFAFLTPPPNLIPESGSPEAIMKAMRVVTNDDSKTILAENCTGYLVAEELVTFLNRSSYEKGMGKFLTKMYNCPNVYKHSTITRGDDVLHNVFFGLIGGTTVDWLKQTLPDVAVGGGLTSRMIFVYNDISNILVPRPQLLIDDARKELLAQLIARLQEISSIRGEFKATINAWEFYDAEYIRWRNPKHPWASDVSLAGYWRRRMNNLLKLGMLFSASERNDCVIDLKHFTVAEATLAAAEESMKKVLDLITSSKEGTDAQMVLRTIEGQAEGILEMNLLKLFGHKLNAKELRDICDTLEKSGKINSRVINGKYRGYWVDDTNKKDGAK